MYIKVITASVWKYASLLVIRNKFTMPKSNKACSVAMTFLNVSYKLFTWTFVGLLLTLEDLDPINELRYIVPYFREYKHCT